MYIKKFEAESMQEALDQIKKELGPDAIILKTITNKGLKRAFKKNKIEITAAISEKNYTKKMNLDQVLDDQQKDQLYQNSSAHLSQMIHQKESEGYGGIGLNRVVQKSKSIKNLGRKVKSSLDEFLAHKSIHSDFLKEQRKIKNWESQKVFENPEEKPRLETQEDSLDQSLLIDQRKRVDELEKKVFELSRNLERLDKNEPVGVFQLRTMLCSLGIHESYIQKISKRALFELSRDDLQDVDLVFEFALREMLASICVELPLFGDKKGNKKPVITILISEVSCGQTSTLYKLGALKKESVLVRSKGQACLTENLFNLKVEEAESIPEYVSATRRAVEKGHCVFVDYKCKSKTIEETKKFIYGLERSFDTMEVLICLSSIHSEDYNRRMIERYKSLGHGLLVTHLDLCLNYGSLFNIADLYKKLPFKFFGTGSIIPEDLEIARAERLLAGIFNFQIKSEDME